MMFDREVYPGSSASFVLWLGTVVITDLNLSLCHYHNIIVSIISITCYIQTPFLGVSIKAGLWTLDWTMDWTMGWTMDWTRSRI